MIWSKPTEQLDTYDNYLRGLASLNQYASDREVNSDALRLFARAIELDQEFAAAHGMAAWCYVWRKVNGWMTDRVQEIAKAEWLVRRAVTLGKEDAVALARGGHALAFVIADLDAGAAFIELMQNYPHTAAHQDEIRYLSNSQSIPAMILPRPEAQANVSQFQNISVSSQCTKNQ